MIERRNRPIGVFDSGVGGVSVLRELVRLMPNEDFLYYGDSFHAPYGTKTVEQIHDLTIEKVRYLLSRQVKSIVIACNTATSAAVADLRIQFPDLPLVGIEPAIKPATEQNPGGNIVVMATPMTIKQEKFQTLMSRYQDRANIIPLPCPGLMEFVEKGDLLGDGLHKYLTELFWTVSDQNIDAIVLGCTHYPFAKDMICRVVGEDVCIFDGGPGTAREMKRRLKQQDLLTTRESRGEIQFENSFTDPEACRREQEMCKRLLQVK